MPKGSLELDKRYITPKREVASPVAYSAASVVKDLSPIKDVKKAAEAQSLQEEFNKKMLRATQGGRSRRRKSKKTKRHHQKKRY